MTYRFDSPGGDSANFQSKVIFEFEASDWHGYSTESAWCNVVSPGIVRLRNSPFLARDVSFEDLLNVRMKNDAMYFESVRERGGHSTYRIHPLISMQESKFIETWKGIERLGCTYEAALPALNLLAVDVPQDANIYEVYRLLELGEKQDVWDFEEGHCGHELKWQHSLWSRIRTLQIFGAQSR